MKYFIGIDPGPKSCGFVVWADQGQQGPGCVVSSHSKLTLDEVRQALRELALDSPTVVIEHTHPGPPSWSVIHTTVVVGRLLEFCESIDLQPEIMHRKRVKAHLGKNDSEIRRSIIEHHGLDPDNFHHSRDTVLQGVTGHAWQALAAVITLHDQRTP